MPVMVLLTLIKVRDGPVTLIEALLVLFILIMTRLGVSRRSRSLPISFFSAGKQPIRFFRGLDPVLSDFDELGIQPIRFFCGLDPFQSDFYEVGIQPI
jgi:hypothetical protein